MKVGARLFKGIEFVQLQDLPPIQKGQIISSLDKSLLIKIKCDDKILVDCLQYKHYMLWYENVYQPSKLKLVTSVPVGELSTSK